MIRMYFSLAPEGDVILVVGAKQFRIRVDSLFLKRHSPVFRAMLSPNFSEGQALSSSSPKEIDLPDDDPYAVQTLCAIMYHDFDYIPRSPSTRTVLDIVRLADKYDCYKVLTLPSQTYGWLKSDHLTQGRDLVNLLAVAYVIRDQGAFTKVSNALVLKCGKSFADLADEAIFDVLPWQVFCRLEEVRARVRFIVAAITSARDEEFHGSSCPVRAEKCGIKWQDYLMEEPKPSYLRLASSPPAAAAAWEKPLEPLLKVFQELVKSCYKCQNRIGNVKLDTFGLCLAGKDLRQISMVPESYWGVNSTS